MKDRTIAFVAFAAVAVAAAAASPAFAGEATIEHHPFQSTLTRAEVAATLAEARRTRDNPWADEYDQLAGFRGGRGRKEVVADYLADRMVVAAMHGEDSGSVYLSLQAQPRRAPTLASIPSTEGE